MTERPKDTRLAILWRASGQSCSAFPAPSWCHLNRRRFRASEALADFSSSCRIWDATRCRISIPSLTRSLRAVTSVLDLQGLFTSFTANDPQQLVQIDREKAKAIGVPISQVSQALGVYMGSQYVNDFDFNNRSYRVYVQADQPFRMNARDLRQYYVRSDTNGLVPLGNIVSLQETSGPQVINHYNLFRSAEIDGAAAPGYSSSQGLSAMQDLAKQNMLQGMSFQWTGLALEEVEAAGKAIIIFALGILVVYLTLRAQYESFALPFIILLAVPMAVLGALLFINMRGHGGRRLCANRFGHVDRALGEELDFDRRVCRATDWAGPHNH